MRASALAYWLLAGCDGVFGLTKLRVPADTRDGSNLDARPGCVFDSFSGTTVDLTVNWTRYQVPPTSQVVVDGGKLRVGLSANVNNYAYVSSNRRFRFTDGVATVKVEEVVNGQGPIETFFSLEEDASNLYLFDYDPGYLTMRTRVAGQDINGLAIDFDAVAHKYWRMQHTGANVEYWTSPNGIDFTLRHTAPATLPATAVAAVIGAGAYNAGAPDPRGSVFDDFEICEQ